MKIRSPEREIAGIGSRAALETVRDDGLDARVGCCLRDDCFGTGGDAKKADATDSTSGEIGDGAADVALPLPAERIFVACAFAAAALVVQEHAVACLGQHACMADRSFTVTAATMDEHDRRAVARAHVPAGEANPVGRLEHSFLVHKAECRRIDRRPRLGEIVDGEQRRVDDDEAGEHCSNRCEAAVRPGTQSASAPVHSPTSADAGEEIEQPCDDKQVGAGDQPGAEGEDPEQERDRGEG